MTFILCIECVFHRGNWSRRSLDRQSIQGTPGPILYTLLQETISPVCSITYQRASHASFAQLRRGNWSPAKLHHKLTSQFNDAKRPLTASGTGWLSPHRSPSGPGWLLHTQISTSWFPTHSLSGDHRVSETGVPSAGFTCFGCGTEGRKTDVIHWGNWSPCHCTKIGSSRSMLTLSTTILSTVAGGPSKRPIMERRRNSISSIF